ncbi:MAG: serine/threonine protein kinase [Myxococcaceae bacterium]|nr:serine/threonine protein kinase [Myxococcaceae bacterium]
METPRAPALTPALLPPGTVVGDWRVVAWAGQGVHGAVYQAVPMDNPLAHPVALKLALHPGDPRFAREAELLSNVRHPSIPRLWELGEWQHPSGTRHPFVALEWVDGEPLYDWARQHNPSSQQVLRLLAQLASALQSVHAQGSVHRDVKGANVLVRRSDSRAMLTDFGSGRYPDAATLTPDILPPGTPAYRSPEAWLFSLQHVRDRTARYSAQPADDLYSLGVTTYRLVTGQYPELAEPSQDDAGLWHLEGLASPAPLALNTRVAPGLDALILRMLSVMPAERGPAGELAEALEQAAQPTSTESTRSLFAQERPHSADSGGERVGAPIEEKLQLTAEAPRTPGVATRFRLPARVGTWLPRLATAAGLLVLGAWAGWVAREKAPKQPTAVRHEADGSRLENGGPAGLGEEAATQAEAASPTPAKPGVQAEDTLLEPLPGQRRPNAKGRCPHPRHVPLNGGCWVTTPFTREKCEELDGNGHMYKGVCYVPVLLPGHPPTSHPVRKP